MEILVINAGATTRTEFLNGREYIVAPLSLIVPGVLPGSRGPLLYPPDEVYNSAPSWTNVPLTLGHPTRNGVNVSATTAGVRERVGLGFVSRPSFSQGKLRAEGWFNVSDTRRIAPDVYDSLKSGRPVELSTGLFTDNEMAANGSHHNGRSYTHVARNYRPDHVAVLVNETGACSLRDGCGVLVNRLVTNVLPDVSSLKACKIVKDGSVNGHPLTKSQKRLFGMKCGEKNAPTGNTSEVVDGSCKCGGACKNGKPGKKKGLPMKVPTGKSMMNKFTGVVNCGGKGGKKGPCPLVAGDNKSIRAAAVAATIHANSVNTPEAHAAARVAHHAAAATYKQFSEKHTTHKMSAGIHHNKFVQLSRKGAAPTGNVSGFKHRMADNTKVPTGK